VRGRRAAADERARLAADVATLKRRTGLLEGVARLVGEPDRARVGLVIAEALAEASRASGAAVYLVTGEGAEGRTRLAAVGSASMLDGSVGVDRIPEGMTRIPLAVGSRTVGYAVLDNATNAEDAAVHSLTHVASAILSSAVPVTSIAPAPEADLRVYPFERFLDAATREIERARRHGRRLAIGAIFCPEASGSQPEQTIVHVVRESDVLARGPSQRSPHGGDAYFLLLPETGALGAHACRRRVLRLASPPEIEDRRSPGPRLPRLPPLTIGVATYPHDGATVESLCARALARAKESSSSMVHSRGLASRPLGEIVDALLDAPLPDDVLPSPSFARVELSVAGAHALVACACREALRGGAATILVAFRPESGILNIVRAAADSPSATVHAMDASNFAASGGAEAVVLVAEHGTWAYCARASGGAVLAAHSADPLIADVLADRLAGAGGVRLS
jgi:hypothetical protein